MRFHSLLTPKKLALGVLLLSMLCSALPRVHAADIARATGKVVAQVTRVAPMPFTGIVEEILVRPGDAVTKGSPLVRYRLQDEDERLLQRELIAGANTESLKSNMFALETQLAETSAHRNKARQLASSGLGSHQALARLEQDVASLRKRIELLRVTIQKSETTFQGRLKELEGYFGTPLKEGAPLPEILTLTSPIDGHVLSLTPGLSEGGLVGRGSAPVTVGRLDPVLIQVPVYEGEIAGIKEGDHAEVTIASLQNKVFTGTVTEISWTANDMNVANPSYYTVELSVPNPQLMLKPGFKAVVQFSSRK